MLIIVFLISLHLVSGYHNINFRNTNNLQDDLNEFENEERMFHGEKDHAVHRSEEFKEDKIIKRSVATPLNNFQSKALLSHNNARSRHQNTANLIYSKTLEDHALKYALHLANTNIFQHDPSLPSDEGENLYMTRADNIGDVCDASFAWYNEIMQFKYEKVSTSYNYYPIGPELGHFTQMVWKTTSEVGCAGAYRLSVSPSQGKYDTYIVCRYRQPGNEMFQFPQNIMPLKPGSPTHFGSYPEVCGAACVDTDPSYCMSKAGDCNRGFFGKTIRTRCPKTCNQC